jgi:nicotinamide-nucleotide amidase
MIKKIIKKGLKIATAESCTGGLLAARITSEAGASACFDMGLITYSNQSKIQMLGVKEQTLHRYGAVSSQTALEMSEGIKKLSGADIGISVTGIAGPGGGTDEKPVGLVYISLCADNLHKYQKLQLDGDRNEIRNKAVQKIIDMLEEYIKSR